MAMDVNNGRIIAMQGGFSYESSVFNRATQAKRQPGSSFKPFVYASALDSGYSPATVVVDAPIEIDTPQGLWRPKNYNEKFKGINLHVADIKDLEGDIYPDVITMWHYLEHDYSPSENLRYLSSISKPSTELVIEVPNFDSVSRKKYGKYWSGWHTPRHISLFSPSNISSLLEKTGWKAKKIYTHGTLNPYLLFWMSEMEKKGIRWDKSMEKEFMGFVIGMIKFLPKRLLERKSSLGIMTVIARPIVVNEN